MGDFKFDVFLCHNSQDKPAVKKIAEELLARGLNPWFDEWELRPGLPWQRTLEGQISTIRSAAVFVGDKGIGPWQELELEAFLRQFVNKRLPVIPVILEDANQAPDLPAFLTGMHWVDFRKPNPCPWNQLRWGITGKNPDRPDPTMKVADDEETPKAVADQADDENEDESVTETDIRDEVMRAAETFLAQDSPAKQFFCQLTEAALDALPAEVCAALLGGENPMTTFWNVIMNLPDLNKQLDDHRRFAIRRFRDFATLLALPANQSQKVLQAVKSGKNRIDSSTTEEPIVFLHIARALNLFGVPAQGVDPSIPLSRKLKDPLAMTTRDCLVNRVSEPPETGVASRGTFVEVFRQGLAIELQLPPYREADVDGVINRKLNRLANLKGFPRRFAILFTENRSSEMEELGKRYPDLLFVALPKANHESYAEILDCRSEIDDFIA